MFLYLSDHIHLIKVTAEAPTLLALVEMHPLMPSASKVVAWLFAIWFW